MPEPMRFGAWTVVNAGAGPKWECVCDCGVQRDVYKYDLLKGKSKNCGCVRYKTINLKHGCSKLGDNGYMRWAKMKDRCTNPNNPAFKNYGARGITVCQRWYDFSLFLQDMGTPPAAENFTIERIDNSKGYFKDNCRWAPRSTQAHNSRWNKLSWAIAAEIRELKKHKTRRAIARQFGVHVCTIHDVLSGRTWNATWDEEPGFDGAVWGP